MRTKSLLSTIGPEAGKIQKILPKYLGRGENRPVEGSARRVVPRVKERAAEPLAGLPGSVAGSIPSSGRLQVGDFPVLADSNICRTIWAVLLNNTTHF